MARSTTWAEAPEGPAHVDAGSPTVVRLSAHWCQWCRALEHEVLPDPQVKEALTAYRTMLADVDALPLWLDVPGFQGLPAFVFFDAQGRHVLTKSGYRDASELVDLLHAARDKIAAGGFEPYARIEAVPWGTEIAPEAAQEALKRFEHELFVRVNSHDGGFHTPARHPYPDMLLELQRWTQRSARAEDWIRHTLKSASRGDSPRLRGEPLRDMTLPAERFMAYAEQRELSSDWIAAARRLPVQDPYRGLQDPIDHGYYRYTSGPGWYHPHFERRALDNLSWALLLRARGDEAAAAEVSAFVMNTFLRDDGLAAVQVNQPFYARLRADERRKTDAPEVTGGRPLDVLARAAHLDVTHCERLDAIPATRWPHLQPGVAGDYGDGPQAPPDAVGELLLAWAGCPGGDARYDAMAAVAAARWSRGLPPTSRLFRLAAGFCARDSQDCARALGAVVGLELELRHAPPLAALERAAHRRRRK